MTTLPRSGSVSTLTLAGLLAAVAALYALVLAGAGSPFWRALVDGQPVGMESVLSEDEAANAARLHDAFGRMGYRLEGVAGGAGPVPPVFLASVPGDLADLPDVDVKKAVFLRVMLPLVLVVNEEIAADRTRLLELAGLRAKGQSLDVADESWLAALAERYGLSDRDPRRLARRVDAVPPSLALAQAAEESGWGTSRFVRAGNNLFGQITAGEQGLMPGQDQTGPRLRAFDSLHEAVRAYVHNLNTHPAYESLRRARAQARTRGVLPDGHTLAGALASYSERGPAYVDAIRTLIRANRLLRLDQARLGRTLGRLAAADQGGA